LIFGVGKIRLLCLYYTWIRMETTNDKIELVVKLLQGEASSEEKQEILDWAKENKANQKLYVQLKDIWEASQGADNKRFDSQRAWILLRSELFEKFDNSRHLQQRKTYLNILKVAAVILISFGISWMIFSTKVEEKLTAANNVIQVPLGSKTQITLPDGSKVWINSGSKLNYYSDYNDTCRIVHLEGEAYFDVVKNPLKPFIVKTGSLDIKAYGTSFNVKSYPDDNYIEAILVSGVVTVAHEGTNREIAQLKPNQKTIYFKKEAKIEFEDKIKKQEKKLDVENIITVNPKDQMLLVETKSENSTAWKDQKLFFSSETFDEIVIKLERWYGVKIHLMDEKIKNERFTGKFTHNEPLIQVLEVIKITTPIKYSVKLNDVYISAK
jgi:transmembrane sensor